MDDERTRDRPRRRSALLVAGVTMAVLLTGGGAAYWATASADDGTPASSDGNGSSPSPPPLELGGVATGGGARLILSGATPAALPDGPGTAAVRSPGSVSRAAAAKLARALGVPGTVKSVEGYWTAGGGSGPTLRVLKDAPGTWSYARRPLAAQSSSGAAVTKREALATAKPLLTALGLGDAALDASGTAAGIRVVSADPVVAGLPTYGWSTELRIGPDGRVSGGFGPLSPLAEGAVYPVVSAAEALKEINGTGGGHGIGACPTIQPKESKSPGDDPLLPSVMPCVHSGPQPLEVRKAVFGLSAQLVASRRALVPSWLFEVARAGVRKTTTLAQQAVDPAYVEQAAPPSPTATATSGTTPAPAVSRMKITSYTASGKSLRLRFWGGVCSTYSASAAESGSTVKVQVKAVRKHPGKVCVMLAEEFTRTVPLSRDLGSRKVIDLSDGSTVPRSSVPGSSEPGK